MSVDSVRIVGFEVCCLGFEGWEVSRVVWVSFDEVVVGSYLELGRGGSNSNI